MRPRRCKRYVSEATAGRRLLASPQTMFGMALVFDTEDETGRAIRVLEVEGTWESVAYLDEPFELALDYTKAFDVLFETVPKPCRILAIGCGGFSYPMHLADVSSARIDAVEIDPAVIDLAREFFGLDEAERRWGAEGDGRLRVVCEDGRAWLDSCAPGSYDAIVNDSFSAGMPAEGLVTSDAALAIRRVLSSHGVYAVNVVASLEGEASRILYEHITVLERVFSEIEVHPVYTLPPGVPGNIILVARP